MLLMQLEEDLACRVGAAHSQGNGQQIPACKALPTGFLKSAMVLMPVTAFEVFRKLLCLVICSSTIPKGI